MTNYILSKSNLILRLNFNILNFIKYWNRFCIYLVVTFYKVMMMYNVTYIIKNN